MKYRIVQKNEYCYVIEYKDGWFWWALREIFEGSSIVKFKSLDLAREEVRRQKIYDLESLKNKSFAEKIVEEL